MQISNLLTHKMKLLDTVCRRLETEVQYLRLVRALQAFSLDLPWFQLGPDT